MTNPDVPHPAMRGFPFGLGEGAPILTKLYRCLSECIHTTLLEGNFDAGLLKRPF